VAAGLGGAAGPIAAVQQPDSLPPRSERPRSLGGPLDGIAQIEVDNEPRPQAYRFNISPFADWQDRKDEFFERSAIRFNINYTALWMSASSAPEPETPTWAASGILDLAGTWTPVGRGSGDTGTLLLKINNRHSIGSNRTPMLLGLDTGYYGLPGTGFREYTTRVLELNWTQVLFGNKAGFAVGKIDPLNYFNYHRLIVPWKHYLGVGSLVTGTVNWPDPGWGIVGGARLGRSFYVAGAVSDARGDVYQDGEFLYGGNQFFEGRFFSALEVGWTPTQEERFDRRFSLFVWHTPEYEEDGTSTISEQASGWAVSANWTFADRIVPFARFGLSNGKGISTFYERDFQLGVGRRFRSYDMLAVSASWGRPNLRDVKDQYTSEIFYRFVFTEHIELTPDFQVIFNPALNTNESILAYFAIRTRLTF